MGACGSEEGGSEPPSSEEDQTTAPKRGSAEEGYAAITDDTGALSVEAPSGWDEVLTGEDARFEGESAGPSITASTDLDAWHDTGEAPGVFFLASRELAQRYTDDQLLDSDEFDFSGFCDPGARKDFDRPPYSGRIQEWKNCDGNDEAGFVTLAAAPEGRECVLALQIGTFDGAGVEGRQRILDTFEADCEEIEANERPGRGDGQDPDGTRREACPEGSAASREECADVNDASRPATGVLEKPEITPYQYGAHAIADEASGAGYALTSESVNLDDYVGQRITVYGAVVPGYENGQIEGGPPLLNVTRIDPA